MTAPKRFIPLGPLMSGSASRAFMGVEARPEGPRPVVLIWAPDEVVKDPERLNRLRRDTEQAARLDHPNVIQVVAFEQLEEGAARIVVFADGEPLRRVIDTAKAAGRPLPPEIGARVIADACFGVHYAHELGDIEDDRPIVHGVLRPEMLMVSFNGTTRVQGYGAKEIAPRPERGRVAPHQVYEAPEQVAGGHAAAGRPADIYALGVTLYEVLAGRPPFVDEPDLELAIMTKDPQRLSLVTVPDAMVDVVMKAMSKKATDRHPSALALREAIVEALGPSAPSSEAVGKFMNEVFPPKSRERQARADLLASAMSTSGMHLIPDDEYAGIPKFEALVAPPLAPVAETPKASPPSQAQTVGPAVTEPSEILNKPEPVTPVAPAPPAPPLRATPPVASLARPAPSPAPPVSAPPRTVSEPELPVAGFPIGRIVVPAAIVLAIAIPIWLRSRPHATHSEPQPGTNTSVTPPAPVAIATPSPPEPKSPLAPAPVPASVQQGAPVQAPAHSPPEPSVAHAFLPPPAKPPEPAVPRDGTLEIDAEPRGDILIDGKPAGRAPVKMVVAPGRHTIRLQDKSKGIDVGRTVTVGAGKKVEQKIVVQVATLALTAPAGAEIFLDGKKIGAAPVKPLEFYEGPHRVMVTFNGAKMEKRFSARGGERLTLDVQPTP